MKIRLEIADDLKEPEIIIRSTEMNEATAQLVSTLSDYLQKDASIPLYKEATVYYLPLKEILFFETEGKEIKAHTLSNVFQTKHKLYELEKLLPWYFMRISKSAIVNTQAIYAMTYSLRACTIAFKDTHKQVYASRYYYKALKERLEKR